MRPVAVGQHFNQNAFRGLMLEHGRKVVCTSARRHGKRLELNAGLGLSHQYELRRLNSRNI